MVRPVVRVPFAEGAAPRPVGGAGPIMSKHMSKVPSLLFDMEDAGDTPSPNDALAGPAEGDVAAKLHSLLEPWSDGEYMLRLHVRIAMEEAAKRGEQHLTVCALADTLRKLGYSVKMRTALGGGWGGACLRNLRHSFLAVTLSPSATGSGGAGPTVLVDPRFREQFEIAHSTPRYARILDQVPAEVVAPADRLAKAVELLCGEMALAFAATGTPVPPWRQTAAMLSKWQPRRSEEVDVSRGGAEAVAAAQAMNNALGGRNGKLTGGNTVAQKLAMLGVEPATASPISEGAEDLDCWSMGSADDGTDGGVTTGDEEEVTGGIPAGAGDASGTVSSNDAISLSLSPPEGQPLQRQAAPHIAAERAAVWQGIRDAVAADAVRRNTWH